MKSSVCISNIFNRVFRTDAFKSLCLRLEVVSSSHRIDTANDSTTKLEAHDTVAGQNGDITITEEEELNLFPSLMPKQERQQSIRSGKTIKLPSTSKKFGRQRRPPVGSLGKLVTMNRIDTRYYWFLFSLRSPIIVSLLPDSTESSSVLFVPPYAM